MQFFAYQLYIRKAVLKKKVRGRETEMMDKKAVTT